MHTHSVVVHAVYNAVIIIEAIIFNKKQKF